MRGGPKGAKRPLERPLDGRVRALVFVHEAHRRDYFCRPPAYAELPAVREPAHEWSGKELNYLNARRSTAARSANNGLTLLHRRQRGGTDTQEPLCNPIGRGEHLTFVRSPANRWADDLRLGTHFGSIWLDADADLPSCRSYPT